MFAKACALAREFTRPVIISSRHENGMCHAGIGSFVMINKEGWFVTAWHIIQSILALQKAVAQYNDILIQKNKIDQDPNLKKHQKINKIKALSHGANSVTGVSPWFGWDNVRLGPTVHCIPDVDLAVGQLIGFNPNNIKIYPKFKNPSQKMEQGTSLCKMGFPFHSITPTFDDKSNMFNLPPGSVPPPFFPLEGIYTRTVVVPAIDASFPRMYVETSSPGLKGQSGGPTFDVEGNIWAIQSQTRHYKLDFGNEQDKTKNAEYLKNQYLHAGWGVHSGTIIGLLKEKNINFELS